MREILFRGKRIDNGEWIYGYYSGPVGIICDHSICDINSVSGQVLDVDPSTVGQYTGLKDRNGVRIYEGDVLQIEGYNGLVDRCVVGYGIYEPFGHNGKNVGFYLYWKRDKEQHQKYANFAYWVEVREAVCIGNIHDNHALLEV